MCYTIHMTIMCSLQTISRVILLLMFAIEDLIRLVVHATHSYVSTCFQFFSLLPVCLAYCCIQQYYSSNLLCKSGCYPASHSTSCGYTFVFIIILIIIIIMFYTHWIEDLFNKFDTKVPCSIFRKYRRYGTKVTHERKQSSLDDTDASGENLLNINEDLHLADLDQLNETNIMAFERDTASESRHNESDIFYTDSKEENLKNKNFLNETSDDKTTDIENSEQISKHIRLGSRIGPVINKTGLQEEPKQKLLHLLLKNSISNGRNVDNSSFIS